MYPHERSLVRKLADKPFAIIGVNSDKDLEKIRDTSAEKNITWRSFWNGEKGTGGPISKEWMVTGWPTTYLIDKNGVIRYKNLRGKSLDKALETLMGEMGEEVSLVGVDHEAEDEVAMKAREEEAKKAEAEDAVADAEEAKESDHETSDVKTDLEAKKEDSKSQESDSAKESDDSDKPSEKDKKTASDEKK